MKNSSGVFTMYFAKNAPLSFVRNFKNPQKKMSSEKFNTLFKDFKNGSILMEVEFISNDNEKGNFKTVCTDLKQVNTTINMFLSIGQMVQLITHFQ